MGRTKITYDGSPYHPDHLKMGRAMRSGARAIGYVLVVLAVIVAIAQAFAGGIVDEPREPTATTEAPR